ncbi:Glutamine-rich protein 2 [Schistosoma japonicum]|nr:Glutamine-rich protein 2 [Schistosoma japonicum]
MAAKYLSENELKSLLTDLQEAMENKLDRDEMEQLREWLEKRFKSLNKRLTSLTHDSSPTGRMTDDAAGLRRSLMQHYHCISCDRPLEVALSQEYLNSYPADNRGFPMNKSMRPYTTFDLESLRHQMQTSNYHYYDVYGSTPRQCGGTHTTNITSSKRKSRATTCKSSLHDGDVTTKSSIPYSYRETLNLQGMDGHIYRGSPIQESQHLLNNSCDSPVIKDEENLDKDTERNEKLPPVSQSQVAYKYIGSEKREKSQSPQRLKRVSSDEFQYRRSSPNGTENHLPQLIVGSTQLPNQRTRKIQPVQPSSKLVSDHIAVKTSETPEPKTENGWIGDKSNNESNGNLSPTYLTDKDKHSSTYPSPATYDDNNEVDVAEIE